MKEYRSAFQDLYHKGLAIKKTAAEAAQRPSQDGVRSGGDDATLEQIIRQLEEIDAAVCAERDRFHSTERGVRSEASSIDSPDSTAARREIDRAVRDAGRSANERERLHGEVRAAIQELRNGSGTAGSVSSAVQAHFSDTVSVSGIATNDYSRLSDISPGTLESRVGSDATQPSMANTLLGQMIHMMQSDEWQERYGSQLNAERNRREAQEAAERQRRQEYYYHVQRHLRSEPPAWLAYRTVEDQYRGTYWKITY
jgi:hypothetical protein